MECPTCEGDGVVRDRILGATLCPRCNGKRVVPDPVPEPTLADVIALLEQQARTCAQIATALEQLAETVKGL